MSHTFFLKFNLLINFSSQHYHFENLQFYVDLSYSLFRVNYRAKFIAFLTAEGDINDVLIKTLAEAHANTNIKLDTVNEMFRKPQVGSICALIANILMKIANLAGYDSASLLQELV